ncbi:MAG TPA: glutamate cyclase domain-containing protein [Gemmataceae bacterium]|nr:glutamate cyclase domain-containing protein [Gemmataceae bacterium]
MAIDDSLCALRDAIQIDVGNRGLARDPADNLLTACPDDFANACRSIAEHPAPRVGIVTGFMIPTVEPPTGETDGPPGALVLAQAFTHLGIPCVLLSDRAAYDALWAGMEFLRLTSGMMLVDLPMDLDPEAVLHAARPLTHLVALERSGPSHEHDSIPLDQRGRNHTMRARDVTHLTAPAHRLFEGPHDYTTIGIGDGGNEIGMGKVPYRTICRNIPGGETVACRTATDHLIVSGVSNWGAWALAAGVMLLKRRANAGMFNADRERRLLEHLVRRGPLVDGVTGQRTGTVDGLSFDDYTRPLARIQQILASSAA